VPNAAEKVKTNNKSGSVKVVEHPVITFPALWAAYPSKAVVHKDPSTGKDIFSDHCAIHVSQALYSCGVLMKSFSGVRCWRCPTPGENGKGIHAIRAQELANYLMKQPFAGCPKPESMTGKDFEDNIKGRTGIVFFQDYWQRAGEKSRTGDHIDLWDSSKLASVGYLETQGRLALPWVAELFGISDLRRSSNVLFWEIL
jgi:hypothetical protein